MVAFIDAHRDEYGVEPIGHVPPIEYEDAYYRMNETAAMGAAVN